MPPRAFLLRSAPRLALGLALALCLGACDKAADHPAAKAAGAKVLPGSISDAMLNLDQSRARPLLQPPAREHGPAAEASGDSSADAGSADEPAPAEAAAKPVPTN
jgi:hypothetical protein